MTLSNQIVFTNSSFKNSEKNTGSKTLEEVKFKTFKLVYFSKACPPKILNRGRKSGKYLIYTDALEKKFEDEEK